MGKESKARPLIKDREHTIASQLTSSPRQSGAGDVPSLDGHQAADGDHLGDGEQDCMALFVGPPWPHSPRRSPQNQEPFQQTKKPDKKGRFASQFAKKGYFFVNSECFENPQKPREFANCCNCTDFCEFSLFSRETPRFQKKIACFREPTRELLLRHKSEVPSQLLGFLMIGSGWSMKMALP